MTKASASRDGTAATFAGAAAFYAATAVPMSYVFYLLPAQLREAGHPAEAISALSLVYLPYAFRVLWAPAIDRFAGAGAAGPSVAWRYRAVIMAALVVALGIVLAFRLVDPVANLTGIMILSTLLFVVLASGTTGLDGYAISCLNDRGRNRASIWQTVGFTLGGVALGVIAAISGGWSWPVLTLVIAAVAALSALPVLGLPVRHQAVSIPDAAGGTPTACCSGSADAGARPQRSPSFLLRNPAVRRLLLLSLLSKLGLGMVAGYLPILQVDQGVPASAAGFFGAFGSNLLGLAVALGSGYLLLSIGGLRTIGWMNIVGALLLAFAALFLDTLGGPVFAVGISLAFLSLGFAYVAPFKALSLAVSDGQMAASRAATFASLDLTLSILAASMSGWLVGLTGLEPFFWLSMCLCLAAAATAFWPASARSLMSSTAPTEGLAAK